MFYQEYNTCVGKCRHCLGSVLGSRPFRQSRASPNMLCPFPFIVRNTCRNNGNIVMMIIVIL